MRAIDADKLMIDLKVEYAYAAMEIVDKQPTIDPVKHGRWIAGCTNGAGTEYCYCSECNEDALKDTEGYTEFSDYCPHCGAKMDKEG